jgi:hypothetical protein
MKLASSYMRCSSTILPSRERGIINKVKVIKRRAYGLPTFTGLRDRVLVACPLTGNTRRHPARWTSTKFSTGADK